MLNGHVHHFRFQSLFPLSMHGLPYQLVSKGTCGAEPDHEARGGCWSTLCLRHCLILNLHGKIKDCAQNLVDKSPPIKQKVRC